MIVPLRGQITAQRPGSNLPNAGLPTTYSFCYKDGFEYMISRPEGSRFAGDIIIGGGLVQAAEEGLYQYGTTDDTVCDPLISEYLTASAERYFGANWGTDDVAGRVRQEWTGIMGYSADGYPLVGEIPDEPGLFISASFQGHGKFPLSIAPCS
jgi:glycine/D-amino acid oxidase-like deaminating enzyme